MPQQFKPGDLIYDVDDPELIVREVTAVNDDVIYAKTSMPWDTRIREVSGSCNIRKIRKYDPQEVKGLYRVGDEVRYIGPTVLMDGERSVGLPRCKGRVVGVDMHPLIVGPTVEWYVSGRVFDVEARWLMRRSECANPETPAQPAPEEPAQPVEPSGGPLDKMVMPPPPAPETPVQAASADLGTGPSTAVEVRIEEAHFTVQKGWVVVFKGADDLEITVSLKTDEFRVQGHDPFTLTMGLRNINRHGRSTVMLSRGDVSYTGWVVESDVRQLMLRHCLKGVTPQQVRLIAALYERWASPSLRAEVAKAKDAFDIGSDTRASKYLHRLIDG